MPKVLPIAGSIIASLAVAAPAAAQTAGGYADLAALDRSISAFTGAGIGAPGGASLPVDRRLRLAACSQPLALSWRGFRHDSVMVQCPDPGSWHLFVPVSAVQGVGGTVAVARGEVVTIAVTGDGFSVSQAGEALEAGSVGDWIRVRTIKDGGPNSGRADAMRARIIEPGEVEVPLP